MNLDGYRLEFEDAFDSSRLDRSKWLPHYLPQWSGRAASAARYSLGDGRLRLLIEADQEPWCPRLDGDMRVSSLQTGVRSGPAGSSVGQHRFHDGAVVTEAQDEERLYTLHYGALEMRARASDDPTVMVALWMIGFEDQPEHSGEICVCEIFGSEVAADQALVGMGLHPFGDHRISDDFDKVEVDGDVRDFHNYGVEWTPQEVSFFVDGVVRKQVGQSPAYPMQLMLGIYELERRPDDTYPKEFEVDWIRGYTR